MAGVYRNTEFSRLDPEECFYCGKFVRYPYIKWLGHSPAGGIVMHPECTQDLCIRLNRDLWEWQCTEHRVDVEGRLHESGPSPIQELAYGRGLT
jgi:hypothetical protein